MLHSIMAICEGSGMYTAALVQQWFSSPTLAQHWTNVGHHVSWDIPAFTCVINWVKLRNWGTNSSQYTYTAVQNQKAVSAYFTSEQILPFGFAVQYSSKSFFCYTTNHAIFAGWYELWPGHNVDHHVVQPIPVFVMLWLYSDDVIYKCTNGYVH